MTGLTEVGGSPAEPDSKRAAVLAFVIDELFAMLLTSGLAHIQLYCFTDTTHKVFFFRLIFKFLLTISESTEED